MEFPRRTRCSAEPGATIRIGFARRIDRPQWRGLLQAGQRAQQRLAMEATRTRPDGQQGRGDAHGRDDRHGLVILLGQDVPVRMERGIDTQFLRRDVDFAYKIDVSRGEGSCPQALDCTSDLRKSSLS